MNFKDYFSAQSDAYARYRPEYPEELYRFLLGLVPSRQKAWDCATGNGQVAVRLAQYFETVFATDASEAQISHAKHLPNIQYRVATAENSGLPSESVQLITVGQALHWFNFDAFYKEARRVAADNALLAVWGYELCEINPEIDAVFMRYYRDILSPFWPPEREYVEKRYQTLPFPFTDLKVPGFFLYLKHNLEGFIGYLSSWSATQKYLKQVGKNPLELIESDLIKAWGNPEEVKTLKFPLFLRAAYL